MKTLISTMFVLVCTSSLWAQSIEVPQKQRSLITKHTATWCPICGLDAWDTQKYFTDNLDGDKAIVLTAHISTTSRLYSNTAKELLATFQGVFFQPEFFFNTTKVNGDVQTNITNQVNNAANQSPLAQTGLVATYNAATDTLRVRTLTKFFNATEGEYQISILLVEREVMEIQSNRGSGPVLHKKIIRNALIPSTFGPIIATGTIAAGTETALETAIKWDDRYDLDNIEIVTILWKRDNIRYDFVNANSTTTIGSEQTTSARREDFLGSRFAIAPNATSSFAVIQLDLPQAFNEAEIILFDPYGRMVRILHRGSLPAGLQHLPLERNRADAAGMYFLRFRAGTSTAVRRVIFF